MKDVLEPINLEMCINLRYRFDIGWSEVYLKDYNTGSFIWALFK